MKITIGSLSISLDEKAIKTKKKDEWLKEVMVAYEKRPDADSVKSALADAYDKVKGVKPPKKEE